MAKKVNLKKIQKNLTKTLAETSRRLEGVGMDTKKLVKRGEAEFQKMSKLGKAQMEIIALSVKKEQLYRRIGMRVWQLSTTGKLTTKRLRTICRELSEINTRVKSKKRSISKTLKG